MIGAASSLAFRSLLKTAAIKAGLSRVSMRLSGLSPAGAAFHAAVLAQESPVLLVVATDAIVEQMVGDVRFFLTSLQGLSRADAEGVVLPFPSQEVDPYRGLAPHLEVVSARARALHGLATGTAKVIIASARALLPRVSHPDRLRAAGLSLAPGFEISPQDLGARLAEAGFTPEDPVDEHGEFCVRGGVVDFYPAADAQPIRLEFIGDIVESVRRYDAATQRSLAGLDRVVVSPQRELIEWRSDDEVRSERRGASVSPQATGASRGAGVPDDQEEVRPERRGASGPPQATGASRGAGVPDDQELDRSATVIDYARSAGAVVVVFESDDVADRGRKLEEQWRSSASDMEARGRQVPDYETLAAGWDDLAGWLSSARHVTQLAIEEGQTGTSHVACLPTLEYHGRIADWVDEIKKARERGDRVVFVADTPGRAERVVELLGDYEVRARAMSVDDDLEFAAVLVTTGSLSRGFHLADAGLLIFAETDLFEEERRVHERRRSAARTFISDFRDLKLNDLVVHIDNGVGKFVGLKRLSVGPLDPATGKPTEQEFMELRYSDDDKLFIPLERLDLVQKYTGGANPALDRLGGTTWEKAKTRVRKTMRDMAEELLKLYAARKAVTGHAFSANSHWQQEFDDAFEYDLTPDQQSAISDITRDMEQPTPMDRLLCGDVGYGKTEVAMRAAFKAVIDGKQVAFLAPTTVLAFQHLRTLRERFAGFPVRIELISRFRSKQEQKDLVTQLGSGQIDITVGTHRLLSKDVAFRDLGLLVVDEEQRFGVAHKERLKQLRKRVDVLTMTATPIPRTLNMSLVGIRDMSVIETPPRDRLAIQTQVVRFDAAVITRAILTELERGGQVYFVHNRVESIYSMGNLVTRLVPDAKLAIAHGQLNEDELERVMVDFVAHRYDILLATTIVENGLDIPNANTIVVNRADRYGLAQLYQLRGRVGRSDRRAYAYLLIPAEQTLSPIARRRLAAIREFSDLGSGFRIAALDLEIRGAGNLLGGEQSGHIEAVGFDMYMKLLEQTIRELKGEEIEDDRRAAVNLRIDLRIDETYIPDMNQRLSAYRRMASARSVEEVQTVLEELQDRYGVPPVSVRNLAQYARIRLMADRIGLEGVDREGAIVVLKFRQDARVEPARLPRLIQSRGDLTLVPPGVLRIDLDKPVEAAPDTVTKGRRAPAGPPRESSTTSWWTARATSDVVPGFTREAILAEAPPDPSQPGGLFDRVGAVLEQLSQVTIAS
ncbi:MAG TPA: transcription-repair coupling factor [Vicinamibacterales bacterium]|nr:transcription-repair coupling factor [Vicinamibacterales bacterium]